MTATQSVKIFEVLNKHFKNADDARLAVEQIEVIVDRKMDDIRDNLLTKDDLYKLELKLSGDSLAAKDDIHKLELKLSSDLQSNRDDIQKLELKLSSDLQSNRDDIQKLELKFSHDLSSAKVELMRWMFGIFLTMMLAILGLYFKP